MNYKSEIITSATTETCFNAVTKEINKWWSKVDNPVEKSGDEFSVYFGKTEWRFKVVQYVPLEKVTWSCIKDTNIWDPGKQNIKDEWIDTEVEWEIAEHEGKTKITMTHHGLTPQLFCYNTCENGWNHFLASLESYLKTGVGNPHKE